MPRTHHLPDDERVHFTWDEGHEPVLEIESGDTVVVWTRDVSDNQIGPDSDTSAIAGLDWDRVYPLAGPIVVSGAEPGDTLAVEILDIHTQAWGWTAILPGLGLLAEDFPDAYLRIFDISNGSYAYLREDIAIPLTPFFGTMGVCPAGASAIPIMPPGTFGGNMDTRQLVRGSTLYLPVQLPGALFSCGDAHGCQGDGEVCVTGLEAPMYAALRFTLEKSPPPYAARSAVPHAGAAHAARRHRAVLRHHRRRRRPVRGRAGRHAGDGRPHRRAVRPQPRGRVPAGQPVRRPEDLRDRRRGPVHRQRAAPGGRLRDRVASGAAARTRVAVGRTRRRWAARWRRAPPGGSMPAMSPTDITIVHASAVHTVRVSRRGRRR